MAKIESGAGAGEQLTVDPTSKAARATLYNSAGNELVKEPSGGIYHLPVGLRLSFVSGADNTVWAMRNGATKTIYITEIELLFGFDGTGAASTSRWALIRFASATPSGGTPLTAIKHASSMGNSTIADARFNEGAALTMTSVTFDANAFAYGGCQRQIGGNNILSITADSLARRGIFELAPNEGLALRTNLASVVGDSCLGHIGWEED